MSPFTSCALQAPVLVRNENPPGPGELAIGGQLVAWVRSRALAGVATLLSPCTSCALQAPVLARNENPPGPGKLPMASPLIASVASQIALRRAVLSSIANVAEKPLPNCAV